jgi:hypothetical protein
MKPLVIGVSGLAACGKDTFGAMLIHKLKFEYMITARRMALADALKEDCKDFIKERYGFDVWTENREEKEQFRPLLIAHGKIQRNRTKGRYWVNKLSDQIKVAFEDVVVVTDIRYKEFEIDEVDWLKDEHKGVLIHISKFRTKDGISIRFNHMNPTKIYSQPPNDEEKRNDPIVKSMANYRIEWEDQRPYDSGDILLNSYLNDIVEDTIEKMKVDGILPPK